MLTTPVLCYNRMLFSIQDYEGTVGSPLAQPIFQILLDVFGPRGAKALIALICICVWNAGLFSLTSNSRMYYAFARDRGIPGWFAVVNERWQSPIRTVWLGAFLSFILALPSLGSSVALAAATSVGAPAFLECYYVGETEDHSIFLDRYHRSLPLLCCEYDNLKSCTDHQLTLSLSMRF